MSPAALYTLIAIIGSVFAAAPPGHSTPAPQPAPHGCAGLSQIDCAFVKGQYGDIDLLSDETAGFGLLPGWTLAIAGHFLPDTGMQVAAIARPAHAVAGLVLIMVAKTNPADTSRKPGVFFHSPLGVERILMRKRIGFGDSVDTLEFTCDEKGEVCGRAYWDSTEKDVRLAIVSARK
jgi:hypothetical protein